jgi:hypothetical protein
MNASNQIANDIFTIDTHEFAEQPLLILDALDLVAVGGGQDIAAL